MTALPFDADTFYRLRDSRTDLCGADPRYAKARCWLSVGPDVLATRVGQVLTLSVGILLARWCREVHIEVPGDAPVLVHSTDTAATFTEMLLRRMAGADPFGKFAVATSPPLHADVRLHVGDRCADDGMPTTVVSSSGWIAAVGRPGFCGFPPSETSNTIGALFAAGFSAAQTFFDAVGRRTPFGAGVFFDAFALQSIAPTAVPAHLYPNDRDIGNMLSIGAGSVASAATYCMIHADIAGALHFVDADIVKIENISRGPTFDVAEIGKRKAKVLAKSCDRTRIVGTSSDAWWDEFVGAGDMVSGFDVWLPLANERGVRPAVAYSVPPLLIHASTTRNMGASFGRHIPGRDDCLAERFAGAEAPHQFRCSTAMIDASPGEQVDAALPFLSFTAGALIVADLLRLKLDGYPQVANYALLDLGGTDFAPLVLPRRAASACSCNQMAAIARHLRKGLRYSYLLPRAA